MMHDIISFQMLLNLTTFYKTTIKRDKIPKIPTKEKEKKKKIPKTAPQNKTKVDK